MRVGMKNTTYGKLNARVDHGRSSLGEEKSRKEAKGPNNDQEQEAKVAGSAFVAGLDVVRCLLFVCVVFDRPSGFNLSLCVCWFLSLSPSLFQLEMDTKSIPFPLSQHRTP